MATKLYTRNVAAGFTPTNFRGTWNQTSQSVTRQLTEVSNEPDNGIITQQPSDSSATTPYDMLGGRMVSAPLAAGLTFSGTMDAWQGGFATGAGGGPVNSRWYVYVTVGNTDTVRGVLLDYAEPSGTNNWDFVFTSLSYHMATPQAVSPVIALAGDRIVAEIGLRSSNVVATAMSASMKFGGTGTLPPLSASDPDNRSAVNWIEFSDNLVFDRAIRVSQVAPQVIFIPNPAARVSQVPVEVLYSPIPAARVSQFALEVIFASREPVDVPLTVTSTATVTQTITPTAERLKSLLATVTVTGDPQVSGLGEISRTATNEVTVTQDVDFLIVGRQLVISTVNVAQEITLTDAGPHLFVTSTASVLQLYAGRSDVKRHSITQNPTVTQSIRQSPRDAAVTSLVSVASTAVRVPDITRSVTSDILVTSTIEPHGPVTAPPITHFINIGQGGDAVTTGPRLFVTTTVAVAQTILAVIPEKHVAVTNTANVNQSIVAIGNQQITVAQAITVTSEATGRNTDPRRSILTTANVEQTIAIRNDTVRLTVVQPVTVTQPPEPIANSVVRITVVSNILVSQTAASRNSNVRLAVTSVCGVSVPSSETDTGVETPCSNSATVSTTQTGIAYPPNLRLLQGVLVTDLIVVENSNPRPGINSNIVVAQAINLFSGRFNFASSVHVAQTISFISTNPRLLVTSNVVVSTPFIVWNSNNRISVIDLIVLGPRAYPGAVARPNPNRQTIIDRITVDAAFTGGQPIHEVAVGTDVLVSSSLGSSFNLQNLEDSIVVDSALTGGAQQRTIAVTNNVTVVSTIGGRNADVVHALAHAVVVEHAIYDQGSKVFNSVTTVVNGAQSISMRIVRAQKVTHAVNVNSGFIAQNDHQAFTTSVQVAQTIFARSDQPRKTVTSSIVVASRFKLDEITVHHRIVVAHKYNRTKIIHFLQTLDLDDTIEVKRSFQQTILDPTGLDQSLTRQVDWDRIIEQRIVLPGDNYERDVSLGPGVILVPVVTGVFVAKYMTFESQTSIIILPTPEFEDTESLVGEIDIKRSVNGLAYAHTKSTDRRKLNYPFKLSFSKALELKAFIRDSLSKPVIVTDWKAQRWFGMFTSNPLELMSEGRYGSQKEKIAVEIEIEAVKL